MTSLLRKIVGNFSLKRQENEKKVYTTEDYEETFVIPKKVLKWVSIELTNDLSDFQSKCWNLFYWFEVLNVSWAMPSEFIAMVVTAMTARTFEDSIKVFRMMPCFGSCVLAILKSVKIKVNRAVFDNLFYELRDMWPRGEVSEEEHRIIGTALKQLNFIVKGYHWCNSALLISFLTPPYFISLSRYLGYNAPMLLHFEYWLPFDTFQPYIFEIMLVMQTWHAMVVIWWNTSWDMLFCTYLAHITMQFDLLAHRIRQLIYVCVDNQLEVTYPLATISRQFVEDKKEILNSFTARDWELQQQRELIDIIKRHHALIRLAADVESMFSFALLINFMYSSIIICFCGFCSVLVEKWNEVAYKSFLVTALAQTWLLCWYGQKLFDSSHGISSALYECGWYSVSKRIRSSVLIMLQRAQKGVHVTTYGFSTISLASYSTIIKTAWSYFTLLLNCYAGAGDNDSSEQ